MKQKTRKIVKIAAVIVAAGLIIGGGTVFYMFNMPHRDTQNAKTDYSILASALVSEYLSNPVEANEKYLADDGDSKILEITGTVQRISEDFEGNKVVLLQGANDKSGVSCSFTIETSKNVADLKPGITVTIKGVIRSGASYDEDLEMYEPVILEKSDLIK